MGWYDYASGRQKKADQKAFSEVTGDADLYRTALERAAYGDAGQQLGAGADQITNFLSGAGPLADSGVGNKLRSKLYSDVYGQARSRIGQGYAQYLAQALAAQRNFRYQKALMKLQRQGTGVGGFIGGTLGAVGGPFASAIGTGLGERLIR